MHAFPDMARGWESKSVESQQELDVPDERRLVSQEARERASKREGLEMSRTRVTRELESARTETHRAALQNALQFLDEELRKT